MNAQVIPLIPRRPDPMTCPTDETLVLFADSSREEPAPEVTAHLESCAVCTDRVAELRLALGEWRSVDLVDTTSYQDDYFAPLAADIERALDLSQSAPVPELVRGPVRWWRSPPSLVAAVAAALLLAVGLLRAPPEATIDPDLAIASAQTESIEAAARELGRTLLAEDSDEELLDEEEPLSFLASWSLGQDEWADDLPPLPLTTTLADEFDLLSAEQVNSLIKRL